MAPPGVRPPRKYLINSRYFNGSPLPVFGRIFPNLIDSATGYFTRIPSTAGFNFGRESTPGTSCSIKSRFAKPATVRARASCVLNYYFKFSKSFYVFQTSYKRVVQPNFLCTPFVLQSYPIQVHLCSYRRRQRRSQLVSPFGNMAKLPRFVISDTFRRIEKIEIIFLP